jgi:hypothetical protein
VSVSGEKRRDGVSELCQWGCRANKKAAQSERLSLIKIGAQEGTRTPTMLLAST